MLIKALDRTDRRILEQLQADGRLSNQELAERVAEVGGGKLYIIRDLEQLDKIVLEDYYGVAR